MKKNRTALIPQWEKEKIRKYLMRLSVLKIILLMSFLTSYGKINSQRIIKNLKFQDVELSEALNKIEEVTEYDFVFSYDDVEGYKVSAEFESASLEECLHTVFEQLPFEYTTEDDVVIVSYKKPAPETKEQEEKKSIKGKVIDEKGLPLPGVSVVVQGTNIGIATDIDGNYSLDLEDENVIIHFSFVGMLSQKIAYSGQKILNVTLLADTEQMEEVVVTGFQTISKERATGSFSILKEEELSMKHIPSGAKLLEGNVAGINTYDGRINIRGASSLSRDGNSPLVVIDGFPIGDKAEVVLNNLNPKNIKSLTVLKDAASASIYGARAANGVIVITTKNAKKGFNINASVDCTITGNPDHSYIKSLSPSQVLDLHEDFYQQEFERYGGEDSYWSSLSTWNGISNLGSLKRDLYNKKITGEAYEKALNVMRKSNYYKDWYDHIYNKPVNKRYSLILSNGTQKNNTVLALSYKNMEGITIGSEAKSYTVDLKNMFQLSKSSSITVGISGTINDNKELNGGGGPSSDYLYQNMFREDGSLNRYIKDQSADEAEKIEEHGGYLADGGIFPDRKYNPIENLGLSRSDLESKRYNAYINGNFKLIKGLALNLKAQYNISESELKSLEKEESFEMRIKYGEGIREIYPGKYEFLIPKGGKLNTRSTKGSEYVMRAQLNYSKSLKNLAISALSGVQVRGTKTRGSIFEVYGYDPHLLSSYSMDYRSLKNRTTTILNPNWSLMDATSLSESENRYFSLFANGSLTYKGKYSFTASVRVDQSNLFGTDPKYKYRPLWSVGLGWNMDRENFCRDMEFINRLKARASYGVNGNIDRTTSPILVLYQDNLTIYHGEGFNRITSPPNPMLRWEKTASYNLGLDFCMFDFRLTGSLDVYYKYSSDLLASKKYDPTLGFNDGQTNNGELSNRGVELSLSYQWLKSRNFSWSSGATFAYNKNKIEKVAYEPKACLSLLEHPESVYYEGQALNSMYAYRYAGLSDEGLPSVYGPQGNKYSDVGKYEPEMVYKVGKLDPPVTGSFSNTFTYKGIYLKAMFVFYAGHKLRKDVTPIYTQVGRGKIHPDVLRRWTPENKNTEIPRMLVPATSHHENSYWMYADQHISSADMLKLRSLTLGYSLPKQVARSIGLSLCRFRVETNNLWYWSAAGDIDPECFTANAGRRKNKNKPSLILGVDLEF